MAELFRSAFNYISQTGKSGNDFVGQYVELGPVQLRVRKVVAEGKTVIVFIRQCLSLTRSVNKFSAETTSYQEAQKTCRNSRAVMLVQITIFKRDLHCF